MKLSAIDVSYANPSVDFAKAKGDGISAVIIRNGYLNKTDDMFDSHMENAIKAGFDIGTYTYIMSGTVAQARTEAKQTLDRLKKYRGYINYPVFCDMESDKYYDKTLYTVEKRTAIIKAFCETIAAGGYFPALYINPSWLTEWTDGEALRKKYDIWLAAWTNNPATETKYQFGQTMWQWGTADVTGIKGDVDADLVYIDYPAKIRALGKNFLPDEQADCISDKAVYKSCGTPAIRSSYHKDGSDNIIGRCEKGKLYAMDGYADIDGAKWLSHAGRIGWSMYKDGLILFERAGDYKEYKVTAGRLNVRTEPNGKKLGEVSKGDTLYGTGIKDDWLKIVFEGDWAYVSKTWVK